MSFDSEAPKTLYAQELAIDCPRCSSGITRTLEWLATHSELQCSICDAVMSLDPKTIAANLERDVQLLRELERDLLKLSSH